jgi:hypothetical protein
VNTNKWQTESVLFPEQQQEKIVLIGMKKYTQHVQFCLRSMQKKKTTQMDISFLKYTYANLRRQTSGTTLAIFSRSYAKKIPTQSNALQLIIRAIYQLSFDDG